MSLTGIYQVFYLDFVIGEKNLFIVRRNIYIFKNDLILKKLKNANLLRLKANFWRSKRNSNAKTPIFQHFERHFVLFLSKW